MRLTREGEKKKKRGGERKRRLYLHLFSHTSFSFGLRGMIIMFSQPLAPPPSDPGVSVCLPVNY